MQKENFPIGTRSSSSAKEEWSWSSAFRPLNILKFILALFILLASALADDKPHPDFVVLDYMAFPAFDLEEAYFLIDFGEDQTKRVKALTIPSPQNEKPLQGSKSWLIGTKVEVPRSAWELNYSIILIGNNNRYEFVPPTTVDLKKEEFFEGSTDVLRTKLLQRKEVSSSLKTQIQAQEESLRRLNADADLIGNFGRILEVREEIDRVNSDLTNLNKDIENLEKYLKLAKSRPAPTNFVGRERQLTRQIAELADTARNAESGELMRRSGAETDLQKKLSMIEDTRFDDYDTLQHELGLVRKRRELLEKQQAAVGEQ